MYSYLSILIIHLLHISGSLKDNIDALSTDKNDAWIYHPTSDYSEAINRRRLDICGDTPFFRFHIKIHSPNYPNPYDNNLSCVKRIKVPKNYLITMYAHYFHLERGFRYLFTRKPNDYLQINDGPLLSGYRTDKYLLEAEEGDVTLKFVTDYANNWGTYKGFEIEFWMWNPNSTWLRMKEVAEQEDVTDHASLAFSASETDNKSNKHRYLCYAIGLISSLLIIFLLTIILFGYLRHRSTSIQMKQLLLQSIDEIADRMMSNRSNFKFVGHGVASCSAAHQTNIEKIESQEQLLKDTTRNDRNQQCLIYDEIINSRPASISPINQTEILPANREAPPSYEDVKKKF
ncbi:hypothetical protein GJ496_007988 [Pomphorhynchus laevis]|nr:hypothetical protein GJ496_007988 [Pomphorhynchus laevis]